MSAAGAFRQKPGCPDYHHGGMTVDRLNSLCRGECYNPSDERKLITRIEVVRIRPQMLENEPMLLPDGSSRIQDVWQSFDCAPDPAGCVVEFEDPGFGEARRDVLYYVRAIQEPGEYINADKLRTTYDESGSPVSVNPCCSDERTDKSDLCLGTEEGRAWSSPIFVNFDTGGAGQ